MDEARLERLTHGLTPTTEGWFVVNVSDAQWTKNPRFGRYTGFESRDARFPHFGINIHIIAPDQPACLYHRENCQENFLVLSGQCTLIVEGEERALEPWDFVHCPPETNHVFVGRGDAPCAILMVGHRRSGTEIVYPVDDAALARGAGATEETPEPSVAYAGTPESEAIDSPWPLS